MLRLAVRGLATHKLRAGLTAVAILLGVAMVAGTLILSDSVNRSFDDIFAEANEGIDVSVRAPQAFETGFEAPQSGAALDEELVERVEGVEGVEQASGSIGDDAAISILDDEGERIGPPQGGPPHIATSVEPEPFSPYTYVEGRAPEDGDEVAVDSITADEEDLEVGDPVPITGTQGVKEYELAGIARFGSGVPLGGASLVAFTLPEAQRITAKQGEVDQIAVEAAEGMSPGELRDRIQAELGDAAQVRTGEEIASEDAEDIKEGFGFLTTALLVFAGIAVFVGAFLIFNTFSITVAQRTREFGMLRTLGASSRQVLTSVVGEAVVLGLLASAAGIAAGALFVEGLVALFGALGFELPQSGLPLEPRTVVVALAVGMTATLGSALVPAVRATRVSPLAALQENPSIERDGGGRRRTVAAVVLIVAGVALILSGLFSGGGFEAALSAMGAGLVLLFVGIAMLGARLVAPLASLIGRPIEALRGVTGRLARENTLRNPGRTATTSSALMIGAALVVFVLMLASAITKSVSGALETTFTGDLAVYNADGFSPISRDIAPAISRVEGIAATTAVAATGTRFQSDPPDETELVFGWDPQTLTAAAELDWVEGSDQTLAELGSDGAILEEGFAEEEGLGVGDEITLVNSVGDPVPAEVEGIVRDRIALLIDSVALPVQRLREQFEVRQDQVVLVSFEEGAAFAAVREEVDALLASRFPQAEARSQQQLEDEQEEQINQLVFLIYAMLTLSVLISLVGVVNTLVLTVLERRRELGMLRAIGASRSQVRRMVRYESVITAMIGAVIGSVIGIGVAVAAVEALEDEGLLLSFPVLGIVAVLVVAAVAGVVAAIWPARRASRIEVMEALQYE